MKGNRKTYIDMEEKKLIVGECTAHLLNARRLLEELQEEVVDAYRDLGANETDTRPAAPRGGADMIREARGSWLAGRVEAWAYSRFRPTEI